MSERETDHLIEQIVAEAEANIERAKPFGAQSFFCEHWEKIKEVILYLGELGGRWGELVAKVLIKIGQRYYDRNCK